MEIGNMDWKFTFHGKHEHIFKIVSITVRLCAYFEIAFFRDDTVFFWEKKYNRIAGHVHLSFLHCCIRDRDILHFTFYETRSRTS